MELDVIENPQYLSHNHLPFDTNILIETAERLKNSNNLTLPVETELSLLEELATFDFGRFLLQNKGLNGYWTHYMINEEHTDLSENSLEYWLLNRAPMTLATQERFEIFQEATTNLLEANMTLASIPCGLMDDLLSLDYTNKQPNKLVGIDLDSESLNLASLNAQTYGQNLNIEFEQANAFELGKFNEYDIITSNGLNIYEADNNKVTKLYQEFYNALKDNGYLITSFTTPSPIADPNSSWKNFNMADLIKQKALLVDIIQANFQAFRSEVQTKEQLENVGFEIVNVIYDSQGMFPTIIAKKVN